MHGWHFARNNSHCTAWHRIYILYIYVSVGRNFNISSIVYCFFQRNVQSLSEAHLGRVEVSTNHQRKCRNFIESTQKNRLKHTIKHIVKHRLKHMIKDKVNTRFSRWLGHWPLGPNCLTWEVFSLRKIILGIFFWTEEQSSAKIIYIDISLHLYMSR